MLYNSKFKFKIEYKLEDFTLRGSRKVVPADLRESGG